MRNHVILKRFMFLHMIDVGISKVLLENGWNSKQMITEGEAAIPLCTPSVIKTKQNKDQLQ